MKRLWIIKNDLLKNCRISNCEIKENDTDKIVATCITKHTPNNNCKNCDIGNEITLRSKTYHSLSKKYFK